MEGEQGGVGWRLGVEGGTEGWNRLMAWGNGTKKVCADAPVDAQDGPERSIGANAFIGTQLRPTLNNCWACTVYPSKLLDTIGMYH